MTMLYLPEVGRIPPEQETSHGRLDFDTLAAADELRDAGFDERQARAIVSVQNNAPRRSRRKPISRP